MARAKTLVVEYPVEGVALVTLDHPPVNALDRATREALLDALDHLEAREEVRAVVLAARGRVFCAGADIAEKARLIEDAAD
jgi:enoyl-CoA hydratase